MIKIISRIISFWAFSSVLIGCLSGVAFYALNVYIIALLMHIGISSLPVSVQLTLAVVTIALFIVFLFWRNSTKLERRLKDLTVVRARMVWDLDSRTWWNIEVKVCNSITSGSKTAYWTCVISVAASDEETPLRRKL